ncbi:MAG: hypothetical protein H7A24_10710 [Leptospiraceae bacterium]|nr:hypothetical protein [Leptospiraceae bacterium]MCP5512342.1 hypothetical protein [Leptospiraceae bacterium]
MKFFFLYLLTGFMILFQSYYSMLWTYWGASSTALLSVAFYSSIFIFLSAFIFLFSPRKAAITASISSILASLYYIQAFFSTGTSSPKLELLNKAIAILPIMLCTLIVIHGIAFFFFSDLITERNPKWKSYFPEPIHRNLAYIIVSATALTLTGIVSVFMIYSGVQKKIISETNWTIEEDTFYQEKKVLLSFPNARNYFISVYSNTLSDELIKSNSSTVKVEMTVTLDFGKLRGYHVQKLNDKKPSYYGNYVFYFECGSGYPECEDQYPIQKPWE